jgi:probable rRNA maturation factor
MILLDPDLDPGIVPRRSSPVAVPRMSRSARPASRLQRVPSARTLSRFLAEAQEAVRLRGQVTVLLSTDAAIRKLNRRFRGIDRATDVLSFPAGRELAGQIAGDLAISIPTARRQAQDQGHALAIEVKVLILHGLLHLAGYDHEADTGQMARRERILRGRLGLPHGLIERVTGVPKTVVRRTIRP